TRDRAAGRSGGELDGGAGTRARGARASGNRGTPPDGGGGRVADTRRRAAAALRPRPRTCRTRRADDRRTGRQRPRVSGARSRGALVSDAGRADDVSAIARRELPPLLRAIHDPPARLHLRGAGDAGLLACPAVAIVGAR